MNVLSRIFFFFIFAALSGFAADAQEIESSVDSSQVHYGIDSSTTAKKTFLNTCCYYKFVPLDTMYYHIMSRDSIVVDYGTALLKDRSELLRVVCDSVGRQNKHFYMNLSLVDCFISEYENGSSDTVRHSDSEWLNRVEYVEIDSVGERYGVAYDDSTKLGFTPGGAFAPYLLFGFQRPCSDTGVSYNGNIETDYIVENGLPCPFIRNAYLFTNHGAFDTLGYKTNRLDFVKTAQGSVIYGEGSQKLRVTNIIASGGTLDVGLDLKIPIHFFQTQEQKLTFHKADDSTMPGMHYTNTNFTLVSYRPCAAKTTHTKVKARKTRRHK